MERYLDCEVSGTKESRPALNRLMNDARQRKFDILLVWKIDRFGRSLKHLVNSKRLGRPHLAVDLAKVTRLRDSGTSWRTISEEMGLSVGKLHKAFHQRSLNV